MSGCCESALEAFDETGSGGAFCTSAVTEGERERAATRVVTRAVSLSSFCLISLILLDRYSIDVPSEDIETVNPV